MDIIKTLQGDDWLGHHLHPALIAFPIGLWGLGLAMDAASIVSKNECVRATADYATMGGLIGAGMAITTGLSEYARITRGSAAKKDAFAHGALNATATILYGLNAGLRIGNRHRGKLNGLLPRLLSLAGFGIITYTGWLGGKLAYDHAVGVQLGPKPIRREITAPAPGPAEERKGIPAAEE